MAHKKLGPAEKKLYKRYRVRLTREVVHCADVEVIALSEDDAKKEAEEVADAAGSREWIEDEILDTKYKVTEIP